MYLAHPSKRLHRTFQEKPYQGASPFSARFLFVGLDANYAENVEAEPIFPRLLEYHEDGPAFWRRRGVHHPFLLPEYSGSGKRYHRNFARIGFGPEQADEVSFIEVLHVPTTGISSLIVSDLDPDHLRLLSDVFLNGWARHIFVSDKVARLLQSTRRFPWLFSNPTAEASGLTTYFRSDGKAVYKHLHFSNYGRFQERLDEEVSLIRSLIFES